MEKEMKIINWEQENHTHNSWK